MRTLIVGASNKSHRISNQAFHMLTRYGHEVVLVHPKLKNIEGTNVLSSIKLVTQQIDTVTLYVNSSRSSKMLADLINLNPRRIIFNPGAENAVLKTGLHEAGIECIEACTLIMLQTGGF